MSNHKFGDRSCVGEWRIENCNSIFYCGIHFNLIRTNTKGSDTCLLYTSDAADERSSVDLGGRRIIKKKKQQTHTRNT